MCVSCRLIEYVHNFTNSKMFVSGTFLHSGDFYVNALFKYVIEPILT